MKELWIIYNSEEYYPGAEEFDDEQKAREKWEKLKKDRINDNPDYFRIDYLAKVIEKNGVDPCP